MSQTFVGVCLCVLLLGLDHKGVETLCKQLLLPVGYNHRGFRRCGNGVGSRSAINISDAQAVGLAVQKIGKQFDGTGPAFVDGYSAVTARYAGNPEYGLFSTFGFICFMPGMSRVSSWHRKST